MADSSFFDNESSEKPSDDIPNFDGTADSGFKTEDGRLAAIIAYIPIACFIPLVMDTMKHNEEARFHARQGVVLFVIELLALFFLIEPVAHFVFTAVLIVAVVLAIVGIVMAFQGKSYKLPIIGDLADKSKL